MIFKYRFLSLISLFLLITIVSVSLGDIAGVASETQASGSSAQSTGEPVKFVLPVVYRSYPWPSPFGVETQRQVSGERFVKAQELGVKSMRLHRISWRKIQPVEGGAYDWSVLSTLDDELRALRNSGITPILIVAHSPSWATINQPFVTDCGAIRSDKFGAFAQFMQALVSRYKQPEFGVQYWELGNEPDVDPRDVPVDYPFGCWGDPNDPYYGGRHYGDMLKVVTPAIRAADPNAKVMIGGLLLPWPSSPDTSFGSPELFFRGILEAGASPYDYFDIVAYHAYPVYTGLTADYDNTVSGWWTGMGGWTVGKARFLRQTMAEYGIDKPLFLNEMALGCEPEFYDKCDPAQADFYEAQADFLVRTLVRDLAEGIDLVLWYTLDGPAWRDVSLLDKDNKPRPAYLAYQNLTARLENARFEGPVDYGSLVEAYSFAKETTRVHVVWSKDHVPDVISVPQYQFLSAYDRSGASILPTPVGTNHLFSATFSPIYIEVSK